MNRKLLVVNAILALLFYCTLPVQGWGQELSREVREKFETMVRELEGSLRTKFQMAIDNGTPVVELTPREFRLFRENPVNPFDINDIDPDDLDGNIELRFELPSLRNRPARQFERQSRTLRRNLRPAIAKVYQSTVQVTDGDQQLAIGTIVGANGLVVTKASEVENQIQLFVTLSDRRTYEASIVKINPENDLALLKIPATGLRPVLFSTAQPRNGAFVVTPDDNGQVISVGSYSVVSRSTVGENQGFLGVAPRTVSGGVQIHEQIESDTAAFAAGLQLGDVITAIDGKTMAEAYQLADEIRKRRAGDKIKIEYLRGGQSGVTTAKLAGRKLTGERAARFKMMSRLGAIPSERDSGFPVVFQHDSPLFPEQCGGPICDLQGNVLGINIARETRASSFAIPSSHLKSVVDELVRFEIASRDSSSR